MGFMEKSEGEKPENLSYGSSGVYRNSVVPMLKSNKNYSVYGLDSNLYDVAHLAARFQISHGSARTYVMWS